MRTSSDLQVPMGNPDAFSGTQEDPEVNGGKDGTIEVHGTTGMIGTKIIRNRTLKKPGAQVPFH